MTTRDQQTGTDGRSERNASLYAGYAALAIVGIMILAKFSAYYASGSAGVLSSLMDSILDSVVSVAALGSIYYAQRPADEDHRWGHGKMEAVSALFQSALIMGGGAFLVFEAVNRLIAPVTVTNHMLGIGVMGMSIGLSMVLVAIQRASLRQRESLAVEADSAHYGSDIFINGGVLLVLLLERAGAPLWVDPLFALGVAVFLGFVSRGIASKAVNMLMDRELPDAERRAIIDVIRGYEGVLDLHDLRTHRTGPAAVISFDIEVDADLSLRAAHDIARGVETALLQIYPEAEILIHVDPAGETEDSRHKVMGVHL